MALSGGTVDSDSAAGIWDMQPGVRADVIETRAEGVALNGKNGLYFLSDRIMVAEPLKYLCIVRRKTLRNLHRDYTMVCP